MPKIPLYNQGQGGTVQTAAGALSPRANVGAFTAPGQAQAAFAEKAGQIAFQFGMAEKEAETQKAKRDITALVNQQMNDWTNNNQDTTVEGYQASAAAEKERLRLSALEGMRGSLTRRQFADVSGSFDSTFATKVAQGSQIAHTKNMKIRTESADAYLENMYSEMASLNPNSDLYKTKASEINGQFDSFIGQGISPTAYKDRSAFFKSVDAGGFSRGVEAAGSQSQIEQMRKDLEGRDDLSASVFSARNSALNAKEKIIQGEIAESVFNELVSTPDASKTFQTEEGLNEAINQIRNGEIGYVTAEGEQVAVDLSQLKSSTKETLIARMKARFSNVQNKEQNALLLGLDSTLYNESTTLADVVNLEEQLDSRTGMFAGMDDIGQINQARAAIGRAKTDVARKELAGALQSQKDLIASIGANKGVMEDDDEAALAQITSVMNMAGREELAFQLQTAVTVEQNASQQFTTIQFASEAEQKSVLDAASKNVDTDVGKQTYERLQAKVAAAKKEMETDFVGYYIREREVRPTASQLITIQKNMGVPELDIRVATNAEMIAFKDEYDNAATYQDKAQAGQDFLNRYGIHQDRVMRHLMKTGTISLVDNLIMAYPTDVGMKAVSIFNDAEQIKKYKGELDKDTRDVVSTAVTDLIGEYSSSILGGVTNDVLGGGMTSGRASHVFAMRDIVSNTAQGYILSGQIKDPEEAAEQAYNDVMGNHFEFTQLGNESNSSLRFEKGAYANTKEMTDVLNISLTMNEEYLRGIVSAPPAPQGSNEQEASAYENEYFSDLQKFGTWRTTTDNKSVYLVDQLGNVVTRKGKSGQDAFVTISMDKLAPLGTEFAKMGTVGEQGYVSSISGRRSAMLQKLQTEQLF